MDLTTISRKSGNFITLKGVSGNQFNHQVISIQCTVNEVLKFLEIDQEVQREADENKISSIKKYIQYGLEGNDIYFPPLIFSARGQGIYDENQLQYRLQVGEKLVILDGQHRIKAFEILKRQLQSQKDSLNLEKVNDFPLTIQVFVDLSIEKERQLFTDINSNSSPVNNTLLIMYKENDLYGQLVKEIVYNHPTIPEDLFEVRLKATRSKLLTAATLYLVALALNDGGFSKSSRKTINKENFNQYKLKTEKFLTLLRKHAPIDALDRDKYVIFYPNVILGIAKFVNSASKQYPNVTMENLFENVVGKINWSHKNKDFDRLATNYNSQTKKYKFGARGKSTFNMSDFLSNLYRNSRGQ
ncbi:DNA sulfur modification protein DndB [Priestia megaterium]|uniref:DNA sulfur modification protein DndB n=1 Tax=Priestia megaterium TaxID=1404 RepID=UPI002788DF5A|nr:DNA sulfur modification protein DndB [Priestia megaterium]MDQ0802605.1 DNA sulfur modification protein DndB [Priestia megaterium]